MPTNCPTGTEPICPLAPLEDIHGRLAGLRAELADLAYQLERQGRLDAADVTMSISAWVAELSDGDRSTGGCK